MKIKMMIMDVDGTLTDGGVYMSEKGELFKRFDIKDGYAIHELLPKLSIIPVIITGRKSKIVKNRCSELEITEFYQGIKKKKYILQKLMTKYNITSNEIAYIGDDINDLECMKMVSLKGCPSDAALEIKEISDFISTKNGGYGCVREFIEWIYSKEINQ